VPADLPPFPGPGWIKHPHPGDVSQRAVALLPVLWRKGEGEHVTEQTRGEWVTYEARMMGAKKGVIAWIPRSTPAEPVRPEAPAIIPQGQEPMAPVPVPVSTTAVPVTHPAHAIPIQPAEPNPYANPNQSHEVPHVVPASTIAPTPRARPQLKKGSNGADVAYLQSKLGIYADGQFGSGTDRAVKAFQSGHGLAADGIVGPRTWAAIEAA
jgi:murein L,D-transpeptidase YcbB/YkuD